MFQRLKVRYEICQMWKGKVLLNCVERKHRSIGGHNGDGGA